MPTPIVSFTPGTIQGEEGDGVLPFTLLLSEASATAVEVTLTAAFDGWDPVSPGQFPMTIIIPAGQTQFVGSFQITDDALYEPGGAFSLHISGVVGGEASVSNTAQYYDVADDDPAPAPVVSFPLLGAVPTHEGAGVVEFTLFLSEPSTLPITVTLVASLDDFDPVAPGQFPMTVVFEPGQTVYTGTVTLLDDTSAEADTAFGLTILNVENGVSVYGNAAALFFHVADDDAVQTDPDIPGNPTSTAQLESGEVLHSNLSGPSDVDLLGIYLNAGDAYVIRVNGSGPTPLADPEFLIVDGSGALVAFNDDGGPGLNAELRIQPATSGEYFIVVRTQGASGGGYTASLQSAPPQDIPATITEGGAPAPSTIAIYFAGGGETVDSATSTHAFFPEEIAIITQAVSVYSDFINVTFIPAASLADADLVFMLDTTMGDAAGLVIDGNDRQIILFNPHTAFWNEDTLEPGGFAYQTILHEVGHALGLAHPHDWGGDSERMDGVTGPYGSYGESGLNQGVFTIMSYNAGWATGGALPTTDPNSGFSATPMALDIAVLQEIYGPRSYNAGDSTYTLTSAGSYRAIWDSSGEDMIISNGDGPAVIDLRPATLQASAGGGGYVSYIAGVAGGFTVAAGAEIENAQGSSFNDTLVGNDLDNQLGGAGGDDILIGGGGSDLLFGFSGTDQMYGGTGDDFYLVDTQADLIFENPGEGIDSVSTTVSFYLYAEIEDLYLNSEADLFGVGNALDNRIAGGAGNNLILAGAGADDILGGAGNDILYGEAGGDTIQGQTGNDVLVGGSDNDILYGEAGSDTLYGQEGDDALYGGDTFEFDNLIGNEGDDVLYGASGLGDYDYLYGLEGDDEYYVDTPFDLTFEGENGGTDTVTASITGAGFYLWANTENLVLSGNTPFGVGNEVANTITGSELDNWLLGGGGNDVLNGMDGDDVLFGEGGADMFVIDRPDTIDIIGDFDVTQDRIDLSHFSFDTYEQLTGSMRSDGVSTAIDLYEGGMIIIHNVLPEQFSADDFILG